MTALSRKLTLEQFPCFSPDVGAMVYEFCEEQPVPKVTSTFFRASLTLALLGPLNFWCQSWGRVRSSWAVSLQRQGEDWLPVPDLLYVSHERLPPSWMKDEPCPAIPELVIEITSTGQSFGALLQKVRDYLDAGVLRVWIVDSSSKSITVFYPDAPPCTFTGDHPIADSSLLWLRLTPEQIFRQAGMP